MYVDDEPEPEGLEEFPASFLAAAEAADIDPQFLAFVILGFVSKETACKLARKIKRADWEQETGADEYPRDRRRVSCSAEE